MASGSDTIEFEEGANVTLELNANTKKLKISSAGGVSEPPVTSVNSKTGAVVLNATDVGALPSGTQYVSPSTLNSYQTKLTAQTAYRDKGTATKVPTINTNELGQVTSISEVPINVGQDSKADKVNGAVSGNLAGLDVNGNLTDSGISPSIIQLLQLQINDIYSQILGLNVTATPTGNVVAGHGATIGLSVATTDEMDGITIFRLVNPGSSETRTQVYSDSTTGYSWSYADTYNDSAAPATAGSTLAYQIIVTKNNPSIEKAVTVYVEVKEDRVVSLAWSGANISPSTVPAGGTATFSVTSVTATYLSGDTANVTSSATLGTTGGGYFVGTTYHAPNAAGTYTIYAEYDGVSTPTINVTVEAARLNVSAGAGTTYSNATLVDTGNRLSNNMIVTITNADGDYIFIKVDKRDTVSNLYTYPGPNMEQFEYPIALSNPVVDGDYKYYQSVNRYNADTAQYKINKV